jgi:hypothetical protein
MQNLLFFLWMMFFPLMDDVSDYIKTLSTGKKIEDKESDYISAIFFLLVYFIVGIFLYKN